MISLSPSSFLNKTGVPGCSTHLSLRQPRSRASPALFRVFFSLGSNHDPNAGVLIQTSASSLDTSAADLVPKSTVSGGVQDVYGEDAATEDMPIIALRTR